MSNRAEQAAAFLIASRRTGRTSRALPDDLAPRALAESFEIQHAVVKGLGARIAGYKISIFPDGSNAVAPILADLVVKDAAKVSLAPTARMGIELEFGFRFAKALAADASAAQVLDAIGETVVTIELCDTRYDTIDGLAKEMLVADLISNRGAVTGTGLKFDKAANFKGATCRQIFDGKVQMEKTGSHPNGDPLLPLPLLPKALATAGYSLDAGQFVITGSLTGITWVKAPLDVAGEIDGWGRARVTLLA